MIDSPNDATRRLLLRRGLGLAGAALLGAPALARAAADAGAPALPQVTFLAPEAAADALAHGDTYYAGMGLQEIRARVRAELPGASLADARVAVRDDDVAAILPFSDEARTALRGIVERMQPLLAQRAPLYARTPWSFIQLDDRAEGGMPHTRGPHIVLPKAAVDAWVAMHREMTDAGKLAETPRGRGLLLHEQTHVLERLYPERFEPLITRVFGFTRLPVAPITPWLAAHRCTNPDGPDVVWAFNLEHIGGDGWILPDVVLPDGPLPRMPEDFRAVAIDLARDADGWRIVEEHGEPKRQRLDKVPSYDSWFPFPDEDFHPNEIAAVALSHWILKDVPNLAALPKMADVGAWAALGLR